nr:PilW family protein [Chromobacterium sp. ASV5]
MKPAARQAGFSLVELMVAVTIGLLLLSALVGVMVAGRQNYSTGSGQGTLQNVGATVANQIAQSARSAGFYGCSSASTVDSQITATGVLGNFSLPVTGYGAQVASSTLNLTPNGGNDSTASHWSPALDGSLLGQVQPGSDVLVFAGQTSGSAPLWVSADAAQGATTLQTQSASGVAAGNFLAVSNCAQAMLTQLSGIAAASGSYTLTLAAGLDSKYAQGAVAAPIAQVAYFVGQAPGAQSALYQGVYDGTANSWTFTPLAPGVDTMQVLYGIGGSPGQTTQYVSAGQVANWSQVNSLRIALLLEGPAGSAPSKGGAGGCGNATQWTVLNNTVKVPCDSRLRHVYTMTVSLRNAGL